jgi:hypothetical protein
VLIPRQLVVTEDAFRPALAGEPAAIAMAQVATNGDAGAQADPSRAFSELDGLPGLDDLPGLAPAPAIRISGPLRRSEGLAAQGLAAQGPVSGTVPEPILVPGTVPEPVLMPPAFDVFAPRHRGQHSAETTGSGDDGLDPGVPGMLAAPATPMTPVASAPPGKLSRQTGPLPALPDESGPESRDANGDSQELPRRVRQASLAPQLRADPPQRRVTMASGGPSSWPTPAEIRRTVSALQRGWQEGRSEHGASPAAESAPPTASDSGGHDSTEDEQAGGEADGT